MRIESAPISLGFLLGSGIGQLERHGFQSSGFPSTGMEQNPRSTIVAIHPVNGDIVHTKCENVERPVGILSSSKRCRVKQSLALLVLPLLLYSATLRGADCLDCPPGAIRIPEDCSQPLVTCLDKHYTNSFNIVGEPALKRVIVRFATGDCVMTPHRTPDVDTGPADGINDWAFKMGLWVEEAWRTFRSYGFVSPAQPFAGDPSDGVEEIEVWMFQSGPSCCVGREMQIPPSFFCDGRPDQDIEDKVIHELFHANHLGGWPTEGTAVAMEDHTDRAIDTNYFDFNEYADRFLQFTTNSLISAEQYYEHAPWWKYFMEQIGDPARFPEPGRGVDALVEFFDERREGTDLATIDQIIRDRTSDSRTLESVWCDFGVANYVKNLPGTVPPQYRYFDETEPPRPYDYDADSTTPPVARTLDLALNSGHPGVIATGHARAWSATYFRILPNPDLPFINLEFRQETAHPVCWVVLLLKDRDMDGKVDLDREIRATGRDLSRVVSNDEAYDEVVVLLATFANFINYRYAINATMPVLNIAHPLPVQPAFVGDPAEPEKFLVHVDVLNPAGGGTPVEGIDPRAFMITVGSEPAALVTGAFIQGQYWILVEAPVQLTVGDFDLRVAFSSMSDTEPGAVRYGVRRDTDNILTIDRSGSMRDRNKMESAQIAARLYVDTWRTGDKIGVVSFSADADDPDMNLTLRDWTPTSRNEAFNVINNLHADGHTSIGDGLFAGLTELDSRGDTNDDWALVLLSDGLENRPRGIEEFLGEYAARRETNKVPVVHCIAIGFDANRGKLQEVASRTGGRYHYLPEPPASAGAAAGSLAAAASPDPMDLPNDLAEKFRIIAERLEGEQQIYSARGTWSGEVDRHFIRVDAGAKEAVFVVNWHSPQGFPGPSAISLRRPDGIIVGPTRSDLNHQLCRVPLPPVGTWEVRIEGCFEFCQAQYLVEASVKSELTLHLFFDQTTTQRVEAVSVPILASLTDTSPVLGADMTAMIIIPEFRDALRVLPAEVRTLRLFDDGQHEDGEANDGWYGNVFSHTTRPGSYDVTVEARGTWGTHGAYVRRANEAFDLAAAADSDSDGMVDPWESRHALDPNDGSDRDVDRDSDGLTNWEEYRAGTDPDHSDTDHGGENDGSEFRSSRNPLESGDDAIPSVLGLAEGRVLEQWLAGLPWGRPTSYDNSVVLNLEIHPAHASLRLLRSLSPNAGYSVLEAALKPASIYIDSNLTPGTDYYYQLMACDPQGRSSAVVGPIRARARKSPFPPSGSVSINSGAPNTASLDVLLTLQATPDIVEMRIANDANFTKSQWEQYQPQKSWRLPTGLKPGSVATVHVQFRDADGIESRPEFDSIRFDDGTHALLCPPNIIAQCQGPNGTPVSYTAVPINFSGPNITITCAPSSGSAFPLGATIVQCTAAGGNNESATCSFTVSIVDTNSPVLICPTNMVVNSQNSTGAVVHYIIPGSTDNCDANVTVTCAPASGSFFAMGATAVTCTAIDEANNAGSCSFEVKVNPPPIIAHGLAYRPLGQAQLAIDANGELLVSNIGASGQDGLRVELGAAEGWEGDFVSNPFGSGEQLHATRVHHAFGGLLSEDRLSFSQQGLVASVDFSPVGVVTSLVEVVGQDFSSARRVANNQWVGLQPFGANSPQLYRRTIRSQRTGWTLSWPGSGPGGSDSEVSYAFDYSDAELDFFGLDPNVIADGEDDLGMAPPISAADFFYQNTPAFRIRRASLRIFGQDHFAFGQAVFRAEWPTLSLSNIGSSGLDGVLIPLPQVPAFAAELMPENLANTPAGASFHFEATGMLGASDRPSHRGSLGSIRFVFTGQRLELSADFSVFGVPEAVVDIYDQMALVATFSLGPNQSGFAWPSWPMRIGISPGDTAAPSAPPVFEASVGSRQQFILPNQGAIMGDRVTLRPLGSVDRLSALDQVSLRVASRPLTIVHETTDWQRWSAPVPSIYALWSAGQWLPNSPESTKPDADPDRDGISNFVEYGLGLDPRTPGRTGLPQVTFVPDGSNVFGALRLRVPIWAKDLRYRVWATDGLEEPVQWVPLDGHFTEEPVSRLHKEIIIRDLIPDKHQRFLKIDVEEVEPAGGFVTEAPVLPTTGDSLRIGFYNAQFLTLGDRFGCCDDMPNRARRIGERIRATGFDVIALGEVFDSDAKAKLVEELSPTYPHFVRLLNHPAVRQDSGLMLFSRYRFVGLPATAGVFLPEGLIAFSSGAPWHSVAFTPFEFCWGLFGSGSDCGAQKGAGLVRIQNPNSGRIYNVAFTHLDASGGGDPTSLDALVRASQLRQIREMLEAILASALDSEDVFLLGDLNINGQLFGDRSEWTRHFGTSGRFFTDVMQDAWEEQTNLPELSPLVTGFEFRDQGLTSKIHAPGGSRNRKDYLLINRPSALPPGQLPLRVQHLAIAFGLRDSVPTAFGPTGQFERAAFGWAGRQDLSDHYGIVADLNLEAPLCSPQTSSNNPPLIVGAGPNVATVLRGTLVHAGSMHWYRFDQPGTYSIAVRSGNFTNHVYDSRQLSLPISNYRGEPPRTLVDSTGAEVTAHIFDVPESPLYIRVSHIHRTGRGDYELIVRRHEGNSADDAIVLTPNNNGRPYRAAFTATSGFPCRWFRLNTQRADSGRGQNLEFYVASLMPETVYRLSIVDASVPRSSICAPPANVLDENFGEALTETWLPGFVGGGQLFMVVQPSVSTVSFEAGWSTDLTVIHPYVPGYCPGSATATSLTCREETDGRPGPGDDRNVKLETAVLDRASGEVLIERGPFPLLNAWDKGRNHNVQEELGIIRFLPSEEVRVRLIVRDRPNDNDKLKGIISSLGMEVHRNCNATIDLVRDHGGRYQLNFHMSHGVPAIP